MITSSPWCQFTGVATLCLAVSCSESMTRRTSSKLRPVVPGVRLALVEEDQPASQLALLERGEVHLSVNVINMVAPDEARFGRYLLPRFQVIAASPLSMRLGRGDTIDIGRLAEQPLLLPNPSFATRNIFDAACRLAGVRPQVALESRAAHALLALAEAGHGVAIVPSILPLDRHALSPLRVTHRCAPLTIALAVLWGRRRTLPHYAARFGELLAAHIRETRPHARPRTRRKHRCHAARRDDQVGVLP